MAKIENCPYCGSECTSSGFYKVNVICTRCYYQSKMCETSAEAIDAHNDLVKRVRLADGFIDILTNHLDVDIINNRLRRIWDEYKEAEDEGE